LYVGGLKEDVITEDMIKEYFKQFGKIEKIYWSVNKETGAKRPYCFVYFDDSDAVDKIVCKLNRYCRISSMALIVFLYISVSTKHEISGITLNTKKSLRDVENGPHKRMMPRKSSLCPS
jgi:RNA recognition motif-containing protein